jgi:hypothetical protein
LEIRWSGRIDKDVEVGQPQDGCTEMLIALPMTIGKALLMKSSKEILHEEKPSGLDRQRRKVGLCL